MKHWLIRHIFFVRVLTHWVLGIAAFYQSWTLIRRALIHTFPYPMFTFSGQVPPKAVITLSLPKPSSPYLVPRTAVRSVLRHRQVVR
jgi:hypothetical protein